MQQGWVDAIGERIERLTSSRPSPLLVAIDGRSGSGKSTLAAALAAALGAVVVDGDDFYAGGSEDMWDAMTPPERVAHCIDWRRQRPVLDALSRGRPASWHPYDWEANDGRLGSEPIVVRPAPVVILEGAYSARPELADLYGLTILLQVPAAIRHARLRRREGSAYQAEWEARWTTAEEYYFTTLRAPGMFDLVLRERGDGARA